MRIDFATLAFGYTVKVGGGTPNWATSLGQGKEYKINEDPEIDNLLKGMVYSSVSLSKVTSKIGKGGKVVSGNVDESPIIVASLFEKVYINDKLINGGKYIILVTRDTSPSHAGRLRFKYGPSNTYRDDNFSYSNEDFWAQMRNQMGLADEACMFVYDIRVENQNELRLRTIVVNPNYKVEYVDSADLHAAWDDLIEEDEKNIGRPLHKQINNLIDSDVNSGALKEDLVPEWFEEKAVSFPMLDNDASKFLLKFRMIFSPDKLKELSGIGLLNTIFLNNENKTSLCYIMEFDSECRMLFGSIKSGTSYKYGLHYSKKNDTWATGSSIKPKFITEEEAIELGTMIRDYLVAGAELIAEFGEITTEKDYKKLYSELDDITEGYINKVWFMKYYALMFPEIFPPIYSTNAQNTVLNKLGIHIGDNPIYRMGQIREFVNRCNISNVMFSRIFWTYCNGDDAKENEEENIDSSNHLEINREPRKNKIHPLNSIIYGAPGTGKTYSTVEYAQAIIEGISISEFKANNPERRMVMEKYNSLIKAKQVVFTTFHQSYGYEEFIQGLRPDIDSDKMAFKVVDGVFKQIADKALGDPEKNYVIIIDEINRANISKVFGELITLIEDDKRWGELNQTSATLQSGDLFTVPNNLYIVGTMNSADKSISLIDAALRRRFEFIEQKPDSSLVVDPTLRDILEKINAALANQLDSADLLIGHSYFMGKTTADLPKILNNSIIPLLYEYFYDNKKKVASVLGDAIKNVDYVIEDDKLGRIFVERQK